MWIIVSVRSDLVLFSNSRLEDFQISSEFIGCRKCCRKVTNFINSDCWIEYFPHKKSTQLCSTHHWLAFRGYMFCIPDVVPIWIFFCAFRFIACSPSWEMSHGFTALSAEPILNWHRCWEEIAWANILVTRPELILLVLPWKYFSLEWCQFLSYPVTVHHPTEGMAQFWMIDRRISLPYLIFFQTFLLPELYQLF